jgi:uncharacterized protein YceK
MEVENVRRIKVVIVSLLIVLAISGCGKIKVNKSAKDYIGNTYDDVLNEMNQLGFRNVEGVEITDLTSYGTVKDGSVSDISIDGNNNFEKKEKFEKDAPIVITYHSIMKLPVPVSYDKVGSMEVDEISQAFIDAGYTNVNTQEIYDLDPDETNVESLNEIMINGVTLSQYSDSHPFDADINVICHYPYEKFDVYLKIDFVANLIFSRYDVNFSIDGETKDTLKHGTDWEGNLRLGKGTHTITFTNSSSSTVKGETTLDVTSDTKVEYRISCYSDNVSVNINSIEREGENQEIIATTESDYTETNFDEFQKDETYTETEQETSEDTDEQLLETIAETVTNQPCSEVKKLMEEMGFVASYEHQNSHEDFTGIIEYYDDEMLDSEGYIVTGVKELDSINYTITMYVNTKENIERVENAKNMKKTLEDNFDPSVALTSMEQYGKKVYPYGFSLKKVTGRITETAVDENTWFMKYKCEVKNAYGQKVEMTCEAKIKGPESNPTVYDFNVY